MNYFRIPEWQCFSLETFIKIKLVELCSVLSIFSLQFWLYFFFKTIPKKMF